jgi:hypothetical protein
MRALADLKQKQLEALRVRAGIKVLRVQLSLQADSIC